MLLWSASPGVTKTLKGHRASKVVMSAISIDSFREPQVLHGFTLPIWPPTATFEKNNFASDSKECPIEMLIMQALHDALRCSYCLVPRNLNRLGLLTAQKSMKNNTAFCKEIQHLCLSMMIHGHISTTFWPLKPTKSKANFTFATGRDGQNFSARDSRKLGEFHHQGPFREGSGLDHGVGHCGGVHLLKGRHVLLVQL